MTFCGYHPAMSEGLAEFGKGVAKSTLLKAEAAGRSINDHIGVELEQLKALIQELNAVETRSGDSELIANARVLKGLAIVCEACFLSGRDINDIGQFREHFTAEFARYGVLIKKLEDAYEGCEPGTSINERTKVGVRAAIGENPLAR
jgi:hypothetical protein